MSITLPAVGNRCADGRGWLIEAASERGQGVLLLLVAPDSLAPGEYPLLGPGDTTTPRGAHAAVRYMIADLAHGLTLTGGAVTVTATRPTVAGTVRGEGLEGSVRVEVEAEYSGVRLAGDTAHCRPQPS